MIPRIGTEVGSETRNIINTLIDVVNGQSSALQNLVAEGQLTEEQYQNLLMLLNGLVKKGEVTVSDIDINLGKIGLQHLSDEVIKAIAGTANVNAVPVDGSITTEKLADKAVTPLKTSFAESTKNIFNKNDVTQSVFLSYGVESSNTGYVTSGKIPVIANRYYKRSHNSTVNYYRADDSYITGESNNSNSFNAHQYASYVRISVAKEHLPYYQLEEGTVTTGYEPYGKVKIPTILIEESSIETNVINKVNDSIINMYPGHTRLSAKADETPIEIIDFTALSKPLYVLGGTGRIDYGKASGGHNKALKVSTTATTSNIYADFNLEKKGISAVNLMIYIDDISAIDFINLQFKNIEGSIYQWSRGANKSLLSNGMNVIRFAAHEGNIDAWGNFFGARVQVITNRATQVTIMGIFGEAPNKAQLLFVEDGGYVEFLANGYPELKRRGIPTTWALNPGRLGEGRIITEADVDELSNDYMSAFSYHSWSSEVHANMTPEELRDNAIKCQRWLQKKGIQPYYPFRAAITQNLATNHQALQDIVEAYSSPNARATYETFPFINPYGFGRLTLHGMSNESIDKAFETMKKTHNLCVFYTHGVGPTYSTGEQTTFDSTPETWNYFLSKIDLGLSEGWLEGVTYDMLRMRFKKQFGGESYNAVLNKARGK